MGIFNIFKKKTNNENNEIIEVQKEKEVEKKVEKSNINIIIDDKKNECIEYYDEFGINKKIMKQEWVKNILEPSIQENINNVDALCEIVMDAFSKKVYLETKKACLKIYEIDENHDRRTNILGLFYIKTKNYEEALNLFKRYTEKYEPSETLCINYGKLLKKMLKLEEAEYYFLKALTKNNNSSIAFDQYFNMIKKINKSAYEERLEQFSKIEGAWRAKLRMGMEKYSKGNKEEGDYYILKALKESKSNSEVMAVASGIYGMNGLYDDFEKHILTSFQPEKHGAYTTLNVLEYYKQLGRYEKGLELCKFVSKYAWNEFFSQFNQYEEYFFNLKKEIGKISEKYYTENAYFNMNKPLWYYDFNNPNWLLKKEKKNETKILVLPFVFLNDSGDLKKGRKIATSIPLFLNEHLYFNSNYEYQVMFFQNKGEVIVPNVKYTKDYIDSIREKNPDLNYILSGNITKIENEKEEYEIEFYIYNCIEEKKNQLFSMTYSENEIYKIQNDIVEVLKSQLLFKEECKILDKDNEKLFFLYDELIKLLENRDYREYKNWKYKKILSKVINRILHNQNDEIQKIYLIKLIYDISKTNSQLLKSEKHIIYNMINYGIFNSYKTKLLIPIIFNIYNDEENYNKFVENLAKENEEINNEYIEWLNSFLTYVQ